MANNQQPGGSPPGGGSSSSSSVSYSGATSITSAGTYSNKTYGSTTADQNSVLVSLASGTVNLVNPTVTKSGDSDGGDNCNFYGINSAVMALGGGTVSITGGTVTATAKGANGVFSYGGNGGQNGAAGDGTTVIISDVTINTSGDNGGGIMTTGGGVMKASNLTITTTGNSSAPIRTDRGGGSVSVSGGSYTSNGLGSPAIYSTADITVEDATLTSNLSEGVCIEGQNSVALTNCTLTANNTQTNGNAQFLDAVILYQSQSGDAADGTATFSMTGGTLVNQSGHIFHVTNTNAVINLSNVTIDDSGSGVLLSVCDDGWSGASNVATLNASGQTLDGDILVGNDSTLTLNLTGGTTFNGNISGNILNNAGTSISTSVGTVNVSLDSDSKWYLDGDTYISSFTGTAANVITGNYTLYVNNVALDGTTESENQDTVTTAISIFNTDNNTLITGTKYDDDIGNSATNVTINALGGNDSITNTGSNVILSGGDGVDDIYNDGSYVSISGGADTDYISSYGDNVTISGGDDSDYVYNEGSTVSIDAGAGNDTIDNTASDVTVDGGDGDDELVNNSANASLSGGAGADIFGNSGNNVTISGGDGSDYVYNEGSTVSIDAGAGDDIIDNTASAVTFIYTGGNDTIRGFNATSTISIGGSYSSVASGDDLILTVGDDSITLTGAASLESVNIVNDSQGDLEVATSLVGAMLYRTEAGYPVIAGIAFHPEEYHGDEPTNYASKETWTIESADGLELEGFHYTPENSNDKWVVIIHGYGHNHKHMYPFAGFYLDNGYNVLMVDQRAAGESEGTWLTMGTAESEDIALWTQEIARRNSDAKITLFGVSMGAATAMLAAARNDTANVTSLVEDCGYSNVVDIINLFNNLIFQEDQETIDLMMPISESLTGYNLKDAAPINSISSVKVPTLFITGGDDSVVGTYMLSDLYDASGAEVKEKFVVPGAGHGVAGLTDPIGYSNAVFRFVAEADGEGWETENITDNISLRGTSYNDTITNYGTNVTIDALGGDDFLVNDVDSSVTTAGTGNLIYAGDGNDTIYNHHTYNPTLIGGDGNDSIVVSRGHLTYVDAGNGNDTIIGRKVDTITGSDWEIGGYATVLGGAGNDLIDTGYTNSASIDGGDGNDTITASGNLITINGGAGSNVVSIAPSSLDADNDCAYVVFSGNTTVQGFKTGWGNGSDTVYIPSDPAGVEFRSGGLTFLNSNDTLALEGVTSTAKVNLYHERRQMLNKGVFIADNEWYSVESGDLSVRSGEEVYFVGPSANNNYGVDFSGISSNLNLTLDTAYVDSEDYVPGTTIWINSVHSIRGGAGNTTIIGSDLSDTIIAGTGNTTIDGRDGNDQISLGSAAALVNYTSGGGNDTIYGFNANSTISIDGAAYSSLESGDDVILTVGDDSITLVDAAGLDTLNIIGKSKILTLTDDDAKKVTLGAAVEFADASERTTAIKITGNRYDNSILGGWSKDTLLGGRGNDYLAGNAGNDNLSGGADNDTLWGGLGNDTLTGGDGDDLFIFDAGKDVITDYAAGEKISLGAAISVASLNGSDAILKIDGGTLTVKDAKELTLITSDGTELSTIISNATTYDDTTAAKVTLGAGIADADASARTLAIKITGNRYDNSIVGGNGNDYLLGAKGDDTLWGGAGNDTLTGGAGDDLFIFDAGKDVITDYAAGEKISLGAAISVASLNGSDAILKIDGGTLTVKDAKELTLITSDGTELTTIISNATTYDDSSAAKVTLGAGIADADASARTLAIKITGNRYDNSIVGGNGNDYLLGAKGDDTLWGGIGNDTLSGGTGADTFIYTAGNDVISDYGDDDLLQITGNWTAAVDASTIKFTVGNGSLTLSNCTATTFNVNGEDYQISGGEFVKK